jgi:uncharacterized membrane protein YdjX (TVP38/TMEM64 family)
MAAPTTPLPAGTALPGRRPWRLIALVALGVVALVLFGRTLAGLLPGFVAYVERLGAWGPLVFVLGYAAAAVAFVPGSLLTLAAGALFGVARGALLVMLGATLGATLAFLVARYAARGAVERRLAADARFAAVDAAVARRGLWVTFLLRLSPVLPFNLLNYALGVTRVRLVHYVLACAGMLPGTLLYVYTGKVAGDVARAAAGGAGAGARGTGYYAVLALGLAATLAVTVLVTRIARRALAEAGAGGAPGATPAAPPRA